jgi:hypothetical protein
MTDVLRYVKGLTRFSYWNYPEFNPLLEQRSPPFDTPQYAIVDGVNDIATLSHKRLSARYGKAHQDGDPEAIFTYIKADVWAFREWWVVQQIEDWRHENTAESRKKLHRLIRMYTDDRGRDSLPETVRLIKRDQAIFKELIKLHEEERLPFRPSQRRVGCFKTVANRCGLSVDGVEEIYREYERKVDELRQGYKRLPTPKRRTGMEEVFAAKGWEKPDWAALEKRRQPGAKTRLTSWEAFFQWLDTMAERLKNRLGE